MSSSTGFTLGVIGCLLDFASGTTVAINGGMGNAMGAPWTVWAALLFVLGGVVLLTSIVSVTMAGVKFARPLAGLMVLYGVVMAGVGWIMSSGEMQMVPLFYVYAYGMLVVGILMVVNGVAMLRAKMSI